MNQYLLYAITDRSWVGKMTLYEQIEQALQNGVTMLQLREKNLDDAQFLTQAKEIKALCNHYGVPLLINDNVEVAYKSGADGVHVGLEDMPVREIRKNFGSHLLIGATAKTVAQAQQAQQDGADYLGVGAVFPSPTKRQAVRITIEQLREIRKAVSIPIVAIGGITQENLPLLAGSGIDGVAVVSAIFGAPDPAKATAQLSCLVKQVVRQTDCERGGCM